MHPPQPQGFPYGQQFPPQGPQPSYGPPPGYGPPPAPPSRSNRPLGPVLMALGPVLAIVSLFLGWYRGSSVVEDPSGGLQFSEGHGYNAFDQVQIVLRNSSVLGGLFLVALAIAVIACLLAIVAAIGTLAGARLGWLAIAGTSIGLAATLGLLIGFLVLAGHHSMIGVWLFGVSFFPVLLGSIGVVSRKF